MEQQQQAAFETSVKVEEAKKVATFQTLNKVVEIFERIAKTPPEQCETFKDLHTSLVQLGSCYEVAFGNRDFNTPTALQTLMQLRAAKVRATNRRTAATTLSAEQPKDSAFVVAKKDKPPAKKRKLIPVKKNSAEKSPPLVGGKRKTRAKSEGEMEEEMKEQQKVDDNPPSDGEDEVMEQ